MNETLTARLAQIVRATPGLMRVLQTARALDLPDWMVFSGAVYQPALNHLTGRPADHGLKDYDLAYHDASNLSYEAEDAVIRRVAAAFPSDLAPLVEVRNQARVHLWFEAKFGEAGYGPLSCSADALPRFVSASFALGSSRLFASETPLENESQLVTPQTTNRTRSTATPIAIRRPQRTVFSRRAPGPR